MSDGAFRLETGPLDDPDTMDKLNRMIATIQQTPKDNPYLDGMVQEFMREMRRAMRRGLIEGGQEMMDTYGDPFYEEDELGD